MSTDIPKICADSLRNSLKEKHGAKLKAAHAHELVAAYFGYKSKNALLADKTHPISNLPKAQVVIMVPKEDIDERRACLDDLPAELPDSHSMGEAVYEPLFASDHWQSPLPPFRSYQAFAKYTLDNNEAFNRLHRKLHTAPMHHVYSVMDSGHEVAITVFHTYEEPKADALAHGKITMVIPRLAGKIGFGQPKVSTPENWTGGARRSLSSLGVSI
jgi:hypothetical protein